MASTYLTRTPASAGNRTTWTWSAWIKRNKLGTEQFVFYGWDSADNDTRIFFDIDDTLKILNTISNVTNTRLHTTQVFRDVSAWYHIVLVADTNNGTSSNRFKVYINGALVTSFTTATYPSSGVETFINSNVLHTLGRRSDGASKYFDGQMAHVHFIDGTAYDADTFGETDATTGIWKPKTAPSVTYGTNGFFLKFENSGSMGTDSSGNANNFTVNGTMTQTIDTPSNVFATWSGLMLPSSLNLINGNTSIRPQANSIDFQAASTLAFDSGKWYCEFKYLENDDYQLYGISTTQGAAELLRNTQYPGQTTTSVAQYSKDGQIYENNSATAFGSAYTNNDIIMMAVDADNSKIYFGLNGTWQNSSNPATGTNGYSYNSSNISGYKYIVAGNGTIGYDNTDANFGNGYFGTVKVSTANSDTAGIGEFEYEVPNGYYSLCTKNINLQEYD